MGLKLSKLPYGDELREYVLELIRRIRPRAVILFGSMASGTYGVGSDIDIMVIADNIPSRFLDRLGLLNDLNKTTAPIEAIAYTTSEFEKLLRGAQPAVYDALEGGLVLHDDGLFKETRKRWEMLKQEMGLIKTPYGWVKTKT